MTSVPATSHTFIVVGNGAARTDGSQQQVGDFFQGEQIAAVDVVICEKKLLICNDENKIELQGYAFIAYPTY